MEEPHQRKQKRKARFNKTLRQTTFSSRYQFHHTVGLKKEKFQEVWQSSMTSIEQQENQWNDRRQMLGKDGKYHDDMRPPSKAERLWWKRWAAEEKELAEAQVTENDANGVHDELLNRLTNGSEDGPTHDRSQTSIRENENENSEQQPVFRKRHYELLGRRQRLRKSEQLKYEEEIEKNFKKRLGEDGDYYYEMMGECYVHGMMDGEAMASQNNEGIRTSVFEIR